MPHPILFSSKLFSLIKNNFDFGILSLSLFRKNFFGIVIDNLRNRNPSLRKNPDLKIKMMEEENVRYPQISE